MRCRVFSWVVAGVFGAGVVRGGPIVFWASDPVGPDDTVLVSGAGFGTAPSVRFLLLKNGISRMPRDEPRYPNRSKARPLPVVQPTEESLKFTIPENEKSGAYLFWIEAGSGEVSPPVRLNVPTVYWLQGDEGLNRSSPGGWLRVFGRNIRREGRNGKVLLRSADGTARQELKITEGDTWSLRAEVPTGMETGRWEVFLHNGCGRQLGWTAAGSLTVTEAEQWPSTVFNVRDFGATGTASVDDMLAIGQALAAAEDAGGGVVYLPRGRYLLEETLVVPRYTVIRGEGRELAALVWPDVKEPYDLVRGTDHFGIEDLTLYASNYRHAIAGDTHTPEAGHTFVRRVTLRAVIYRGHLKPEEVDRRFRASLKLSSGGGDSVRLGGEKVEVSDCDLYGSGRAIYLFGGKGARIVGNRLYNGRWGWYCLTGSDGLIFENNVLTGGDLMSTGGGLNCLGSTYSRNVFYARNTIARCHGWDREAMTSDAGHGAYYGHIAEAGPNTIRLLEKPTWDGAPERWRGGGVFILYGRGMGQYRDVAAVADDGVTVTVDRPWDVVPDESSLFSITMMQKNYLFIENHFEDVGIALQYYGTSVNHIASGNTCRRGGGFYNSGRWYRHYQPSWYCQFLGNRIFEGTCYRYGPNNATGSGPSFLGTYGLQYGDNPAPLAYCTIHRRNQLHQNAEIRLRGIHAERPGLRDIVVEHNLVENSDTAISMDQGCVGVVQRQNTFRNIRTAAADPGARERDAAAKRQALIGLREPVYRQDFERKQGRYFLDEGGNRLHGICSGGDIRLEDGLSGKAGRFDGTAFLRIGDRGLIRFPALTISAWILPDRLKGRWGVVAKRARNGAAAFVLAIRDGGLTFEGTDADGKWSYNLLSKPVLTTGWHHVAATCEEGKIVRLYYDGKRIAEKPVSKALVNNDEPLTIGFEAWGGENSDPRSSGNFRGLIDEAKIWSRILSPAEIRAEYEDLRSAAADDMSRRLAARVRREEERARTQRLLAEASSGRWRALAVDRFDGNDLDPRWVTLRGTWTVKDGVLTCREVSFLALRDPLIRPVRIEYDARSSAPSDLTSFFGTKEQAYKGGYFVGFASNGNTINKLLKLGEQVYATDAPLARPGTWHHVVTQVLEDRVQMVVDGVLVFDWRDPQPVGNADTAGIIAWGPGEFDNLKVFVAAE